VINSARDRASIVLLQAESDISLFVYNCITSKGMKDEEETKTTYTLGESGDSEAASMVDNIAVRDLCVHLHST
jgi:hypothetical protein